MGVLLHVLLIAIALSSCALAFPGKVRVYNISVEKVLWDYAPTGWDFINNIPIDTPGSIAGGQFGDFPGGRRVEKIIYREYADAKFTIPKPQSKQWQHLGLLGPTVYAEVGDEVHVNLFNNCPVDVSYHVHGFFYYKKDEGAPYKDGTSYVGDIVKPGEIYQYRFPVPERSGPGPNDPSSVGWLYHSHVDEVRDSNAGPLGTIVITRRGHAKEDGSPKDVDREFVLFPIVFDETNSRLKFTDPLPTNFAGEYNKYTINGMVFGNLPGLEMQVGDRVRWYVLSLGNEDSMHVIHWDGMSMLFNNVRRDAVGVIAGTMFTLDSQPDMIGRFEINCRIWRHLFVGMQAFYNVTARTDGRNPKPYTRQEFSSATSVSGSFLLLVVSVVSLVFLGAAMI